MSIFDTENIYHNDDFWLEAGFFNLKRRGTWINIYTKHLHSDQRKYLEKNYTEITEEEWLKWVEKFKVFHSTMYKLKDWE